MGTAMTTVGWVLTIGVLLAILWIGLHAGDDPGGTGGGAA